MNEDKNNDIDDYSYTFSKTIIDLLDEYRSNPQSVTKSSLPQQQYNVNFSVLTGDNKHISELNKGTDTTRQEFQLSNNKHNKIGTADHAQLSSPTFYKNIPNSTLKTTGTQHLLRGQHKKQHEQIPTHIKQFTNTNTVPDFVSLQDTFTNAEKCNLNRHSINSQKESGITPSGVWDSYGMQRELQVAPNKSTSVLLIQNYSSVIVADEPQTVFIVLINKSIPYASLVGTIGNEVVKWKIIGNTLSASIPPQNPGDIFLTVMAGKSSSTIEQSEPIIFQLCHQEVALGPLLSALPITVIRPPVPRAEPRLAYSITHPSKPEMYTAYDAIMTDNIISSQSHGKVSHIRLATPSRSKMTKPSNRKLVKSIRTNKNNPQQDINDKKNNIEARLIELQKSVNLDSDPQWLADPSVIRELKLMLASLDTSTISTVIPFSLRAAIYTSVTLYNRKLISLFHTKLFELQPFNVSSAHLFMKERPQDVLTIFAFTLNANLPQEKEKQLCGNDSIPLSYTPSLDRFEATDRLCNDPRFWKYIDGAIPSKNKFAETYYVDKWNDSNLSAPIPPHLLQPRKQFHSLQSQPGINAIEIAPLVYVHWEPWPIHILADADIIEDKQTKPDTKGSDLSIKLTKDNIASISLPNKDIKAVAPTPDTIKDSSAHIQEKTMWFGVTLCVGKHLYTTATPVRGNILKFIINEWMRCVPIRGMKRRPINEIQQLDMSFPSLLNAGY